MTKEDEARLLRIREEKRRHGPGECANGNCAFEGCDRAFLLRLLDEQAARVAQLEAQLQAVHYVFERGGDFQLGPKGRHRGLADQIAAAVAPGEVKP